MSLSRPIVILAIAISFLCINETLGKDLPLWLFEKYNIIALNGLQASGSPLIVHCKSKNDDLGVHNLAVGQQFHWEFRTNLWDTTLFTCTFSWSGGSKGFEAFNDGDLNLRWCGGQHCTWKAQEDGIYLFDIKANKYNFLYNWDKALN